VIVIAVENWARELGYKAEIAVSVAKVSDQTIVLAPKNFVNLILPVLRGVYFHKSVQRHFERSVASLKKKGGRFLIIDEEAVVRDLPLKTRYGLDPSLCDGVFATSKADEESFISHGFRNILLTGNPRFLKRESYSPPLTKPLERVLFSSNFSMKRPAGGFTLENVIVDQKLNRLEEENLRRFITLHNERESYVRTYLKALSKKITVIYRVHPLESEEAAREAFCGSNVLIEKGGEIAAAISSVDIVLHAGCTVALDAAQMGSRAGWIYIMKEEVGMEKASLSLAFETAPDFDELQALWSTRQFFYEDDTAITNLIGEIGVDSREQSVEIIANELALHGDNICSLRRRDIFCNLVPLLGIALRWIKNFYFNEFEVERFDKTAYQILKKKIGRDSCRVRVLIGGIFIVNRSI
jgi:surface carbohydrate biosynthesis protein